jgi:hypothetical protein
MATSHTVICPFTLLRLPIKNMECDASANSGSTLIIVAYYHNSVVLARVVTFSYREKPWILVFIDISFHPGTMVSVNRAKPCLTWGKGVVDEKGPLRISPLNAEFSSEKVVPAVSSNFFIT